MPVRGCPQRSQDTHRLAEWSPALINESRFSSLLGLAASKVLTQFG
jgi:hypothetical protein